MYKRPTIRRPAQPRPVASGVPEFTLENILGTRQQLTPANIKRVEPAFLKAIKRRREKFIRRYKLSGFRETLFNASAVADREYDIHKLFDTIVRERPKSILKASLKGGRFQEVLTYSPKGVTRTEGPVPNQLGIAFDIEGKTCYANLFNNGMVRYAGQDESKTREYLERMIGPLDEVEISNRTGQLYVDKELDLEKLVSSIRLEEFGPRSRVIFDPEARDFHVTLQFIQTEQRIVPVPEERRKGRHVGVKEVRVHLTPREETTTVEKDTKYFAFEFFRTGVIQYQGRFIGDVGTLVFILKAVLDQAQVDGVFTSDYRGERREPVQKSTSKFPPDPPDSFEGKCPDGYYCRPNHKGFPSCYLIPVINASSRKTMIEAYRSVGVPIPESVKRLFGVTTNTSGPLARHNHKPPTEASFVLEGVEYYVIGDKIKGAKRSNGKENPPRTCTTLPAETLHKYARALRINPNGLTKKEICEAIQSAASKK